MKSDKSTLTKRFCITLTDDQKQKAKTESKVIFGSVNVSGFLALLIERYTPIK